MNRMRIASSGPIGRILTALVMGLISVSFAVWGVGDVFRNFGRGSVAKIGSTELSIEQVRAAFQTELQNYQRRNRRALTTEQARAQGMDALVVSRMVSEALLDQQARKLGLAIADPDIARAILADPRFAGPSGKFSRVRFDDTIRDMGMNEAMFVREQRGVYLRRAIGEAVAADIAAPRATMEAIDRFRNETRDIEALTLPRLPEAEIGKPTDEQLQTFFNLRKDGFRTPEYRKIAVLALTPASLADAAAVSDADAMKRYEDVKGARFGQPERRRVLQILFPNKAEAEAAAARVKAGETFEAIAAERKLAESDFDLGLKARSDIVDKAVAEAAFALAEGATSEPVNGEFGVVLVKVAKIEPGAAKPFAEVAATLKREIATERAVTKVRDLHDKVEEARAAGKPLAEAAASAGLVARAIDAITSTGRDRKGAEVADLVERAQLLRAVFASDVGMDNDTIATADRGYVWFEVAGVEPSRERKLDEVRADVEALWRDDEGARKLATRAAELVKEIDAGKSIADVAAAEKLASEAHKGVKRAEAQGLNDAARLAIFSTAPGKAGSAASAGGTRLVFKVTDSAIPLFDADSQQNKQVAQALEAAYADDVLTQYLARLQNDIGVTINEQALKLAIGGETN